jgi:hypothetical protein
MSRSSGKALHWILGGCAAVFVLGVLGVGSCVMLIMKVTKAPVDASEHFLTVMGAADFPNAKAACDTSIAGSIEALHKSDPAVWGKSWSVTGRNIEVKNGVSTAVVTVSLNGTDGKSRGVELILVDRSGWKVTSIKVDGRQVAGIAELPPATGVLEFRNIDVKKTKGAGGWEVVVTFEIHGLRFEPKGANKRVAATEGVVLYGVDGKEILNKPEFKTVDGEAADPVVTFTNTFTLPANAPNGKYSIHSTVKDHIGGGTSDHDIDFNLP